MKYCRNIRIDEIKQIHFIGIGGIGMSGIAALMIGLGYKVSGSDLNESEITVALRKMGAEVFIGHRNMLPDGTDAAVVSSAIKDDNPEIIAAENNAIPIIHRSFMLALLSELKKNITIAGTHGKTTTSSLMAAAFESAGADATAVIGGILKNAGSNIRLGGGEYLIAEADESDGSFLNFHPLVTCITNIDADHLDHYGTLEEIQMAFIRHISSVPFFGMAIVCSDDAGIRTILPYVKAPVMTCGINSGADWQAKNISYADGISSYEAWFKGKLKGQVRLRQVGEHNVRNSLLVLAAGSYLGFNFNDLVKGLAQFNGVKRRLDRKGSAGGIEFIDDYGHHPTEIKATLAALRMMFPARRIVVLFQPHRYTRTRDLFREFGASFSDADKIFIAPVYSAGEAEIPGVSSNLIIQAIKDNGREAAPFPGVLQLLKDLRKGDIMLTLGAGDVWKTGMEIKLKKEMLGTDLSV